MSSRVTPGKATIAIGLAGGFSRNSDRELAEFEGILSFKQFPARLYSSTLESWSAAMLRDPGSQDQTIRSPRADDAVYSFPTASRIGDRDRLPLMDAMNNIIAINWKATEPHWTAASSPFESKYSLILVCDGSVLVLFSVYRGLRLAGCLA